jgi:hypothetical protein
MAREHALQYGDKSWHYILIADDHLNTSLTAEGLLARYEQR